MLHATLVLPVLALLSWRPGFSVSRRADARVPAIRAAGFYSEDWMMRLGTMTNSKKKWVEPMPADSLGAGLVLLSDQGSFDHYFLESLVLIIEHGDTGTRGLLLNHETPWQVDEMTEGAIPPFAANPIFLGGDAGRDTIVMIHGELELPGAKEVGYGVYQGGVSSAVRAVEEGALPPDRFKFFYKTVEWLPGQLESQVDAGQFSLVQLSPAWLFGQYGHRSMWKEVREAMPFVMTDANEDIGTVPAGLPYEKRELDKEASRAASAMKDSLKEHQRRRELEDEKLRDFVREIERENAAREGVETTQGEPVPEVADLPATRFAPSYVGDEISGAAARKASESGEESGERARGDESGSSKQQVGAVAPAAATPRVIGFRVFKGNEQWCIRWPDTEAEEDTWECASVVHAEGLGKQAEEIKRQAM